ncbi:MAG: hypothetical protein AAGM22_19645 [Acidobacteriota bacterium]
MGAPRQHGARATGARRKTASSAPFGGARRLTVLAAAALLAGLMLVPTTGASGASDLGGIELTAPVRQQLYNLQQAWLGWTRAFADDDTSAADTELEQMGLIARHLGMERLPDLSNAAAALAIREAKAGRFGKAKEALYAARQLDPDQPDNDFADGAIRRESGDYFGAVQAFVRGYLKLLHTPLQRTLWLHNVILWASYTLLAAAALFIAVLMLAKGRRLFYDFSRLYAPPLPPLAADALTAVLLLWPLLLPSGFVWLCLYWSILLWSYSSVSCRGVLIFTWILLGLAPSLLVYQQRSTRVAMVPAARLIENLAEGRLYGSMFSDLEVLRSLVPDSDAVTEITADLHRRFGQWDYARAIYTELAQDPERPTRLTATAYSNIGVFHHRNGDYETAVNYFSRAAEADPRLAEAVYNLSQAYAQLYDFNRHHEAMALAKELDADSVEAWNEAAVTAEDSAIPVDGGVRRVDELRDRISRLWRDRSAEGLLALLTRFRALSAALAALALALAVHQLRRQVGFFSDRLARRKHSLVKNKWARAFIPGLGSLDRGSGVVGFLMILMPTALVIMIVGRSFGFRQPLAVSPDPLPVTLVGLLGLAFIFLLRILVELRDD